MYKLSLSVLICCSSFLALNLTAQRKVEYWLEKDRDLVTINFSSVFPELARLETFSFLNEIREVAQVYGLNLIRSEKGTRIHFLCGSTASPKVGKVLSIIRKRLKGLNLSLREIPPPETTEQSPSQREPPARAFLFLKNTYKRRVEDLNL